MKVNNSNAKKQVNYLGRWVDKEHFRAFVYHTNGEKKLAKSYDEFESLISSGSWFDSIESLPKEDSKTRKSKHGSTVAVS